jgi:hypothetical protein
VHPEQGADEEKPPRDSLQAGPQVDLRPEYLQDGGRREGES